MPEKSNRPALKWLLISSLGIILLGTTPWVWFSILPDDFHVARELRTRGFDIIYNWHDDTIWQHPTHVSGSDKDITPEDCRLICQLPRLFALHFLRGDMSGLNLDEIGNCQELFWFRFHDVTQFPVSELRKLTASPVRIISLESRVHVTDFDLEAFAKFTNLEQLFLETYNAGVTDASLEYFEKIPSLKTLHLPNTSITEKGVEEFRKKRPDVEIYLYLK